MVSGIKNSIFFVNGRQEVAFDDGSGLIVHPCAESATYFKPDGSRQRLLVCCARTSRSSDWKACGSKEDVGGKVSAAIALRNQFTFSPRAINCLDLPGDRSRKYTKLSRFTWPSPTEVVVATAQNSVGVRSLDGGAVLNLALHGLTYTIEWDLPLDAPPTVDVKVQGGIPTTKNTSPRIAGQPAFHASGCASAGVQYEHVRLRQRQAVSTATTPEAWCYPLLLAFSILCEIQQVPHQVSQTQSRLAAAVRGHLDSGDLVELAGGRVDAPVPPRPEGSEKGSAALGSDATSPAAALGNGGRGPVCVAWKPEATSWFHGKNCAEDATVELTCVAGTERVICSSMSGKFWTHIDANGHVISVDSADALPLDNGSVSASRVLAEAWKWLRFNDLHFCADFAHVEPVKTNGQSFQENFLNLDDWVLESAIEEEGVGRLSLLKPNGTGSACCALVRVQFVDGARLQFCASKNPNGELCNLGNQDQCRAFLPDGKVLSRSFGTPVGCEDYVNATRMLYARLLVDPTIEEESRVIGIRLATSQQRRCQLLLRLQGSPESSRAEVAASIPEYKKLSALEALERSSATMSAIECTLRNSTCN